MTTRWTMRVPRRAKPKARPRWDSRRGRTHMPQAYLNWRDTFVQELSIGRSVPFSGPVHLRLVFDTDETYVEIEEHPVMKRPKHVRGDIDNLVGGVMDALQEAGLLVNDNQVISLDVQIGDTE